MKTILQLMVLLAAVPLSAQEVETLSGDRFAVFNPAGRVTVVGGSGSDVVVRVTRGGDDGGALRIETGEIRGRQTLRVIFPDDEIVYPELGRGSRTRFQIRGDGTFGDGGFSGGSRVDIRGSGPGLEAWADLEIEIPAGVTFHMQLGAGEIEADDVRAELSLNARTGAVRASNIAGSLAADTGSGRIEVRGIDGDLNVDTGSGRVDVADASGSNISIDTGSGSISVSGLSGRSVTVDTGSGGIDVSGIVADNLHIDTGSGSVRGGNLQAGSLDVDTGSGSIRLSALSADDIRLDTGSGSVDIELISDFRRLQADTGSGSINVRAPEDLGAQVVIETGSGGIDTDFPLTIGISRRNFLQGTIGDGRSQIVMDAGSGSVRLSRQ